MAKVPINLTGAYLRMINQKIVENHRKYLKAKKRKLLLACRMDQMESINQIAKKFCSFGMIIICNVNPIPVYEVTHGIFQFESILSCSSEESIVKTIEKLVYQTGKKVCAKDIMAFHVYVILEILLDMHVPKENIIQSIYSGIYNSLKPYDLYKTKDNSWFFQFAKEIKIARKESQKIAFLCHGAHGDLIMMIPVIQAFIRQERKRGNEIELLTSKNLVYRFLKIFINDAHITNLDSLPCPYQTNLLYEALKNSGKYSKILNFPNAYLGEKLKKTHIFNIWLEETDMKNPQEILNQADFSAVRPDPSITTFLDEVKNKSRWVVGLQYFSDTLQVNGQYVREWPYEYAYEFVERCREEQISVLVLVPEREQKLPHVYSVSTLPLQNLFQVISSLDAVVGIDSSCGHIAGVVGTPSITINGNYVSVLRHRYTFRPLSMNYSFYSQRGYPSDISAALVYERLKSILNGKIHLQSNIIQYQDSVRGVDIEWICEK